MNLQSSCDNIRRTILKLSHDAKSAHAGSALSCAEILGTIFWLRYENSFPISKFVLSKGHAAMALYASALEFGLIKPELLDSYLRNESAFWGHPSVSEHFEFIHWSTGSLGHGLPACVGFAYAEKYLKAAGSSPEMVVAIVSDGELNEGTCWEAMLFASHHKLDNLIVIVDYNKIQSFGRCIDVLNLEPLIPKFESFGLRTVAIDGHSTTEILAAIQGCTAKMEKPVCILANTIKGKGLFELEDTIESHYKPVSKQHLEKHINEK